MPEARVAIVGGGLAGLACAIELEASGVPCRIYESSDRVGGRVATDVVDGFRLDRGFQVFLDAYPEARRVLDLDALDLRRFEPGAIVRVAGRFVRVTDPWRRPWQALASLFAPIGSLRDKLRMAGLRRDVVRPSLAELEARPETTTIDRLREHGFSEQVLERFFRPFLGGVFLERELATSSRFFEFVFRMFALGHATLPAGGMSAIPRQLAARLRDGTVRLEAPVENVTPRAIRLAGGQEVAAPAVVVATERSAAARLLGTTGNATHGTSCLYFAADRPPVEERLLFLDGEGGGPINNLCVPSLIAPSYAPVGQSLISCSVIGCDRSEDLVQRAREQLESWFGGEVRSWRHLRTYHIEQALPAHGPGARRPRDASGVFVCGDHAESPSLHGALLSGRRTAAEVRHALTGNSGPA